MTGQPLAGRPRATRPMTERPMTGRGQASPLHLGGCTRMRIEESASAIKDARWNLRNTSNVELLQGKTEDLLPGVAAQLDGLVLDPPRAGCQQAVLNALVQQPVARLVYVSCDPETLARDLKVLCHLYPTYHLCSVQPLDMFPQTVHIECIAVLEQITS